MPNRFYGTLYVVATPIGNLNDITPRALTTLKEVSYLACEDTRRTKILLNHFAIKQSCKVLQAHNEQVASTQCVEDLKAGQSIALVTDAGTPLVSDPGFRLVSLAQTEGIRVVPIPGPCALITALSALGVPCDQFYFYGFLPSKAKQRKDTLEKLNTREETLVFYEAPHRLKETLAEMVAVFGEVRLGGIGREMTKQFEQILALPLGELLAKVNAGDIPEKGECVLVVGGEAKQLDSQEIDTLLTLLLPEMPLKTAVKIAQTYLGAPKNEVYERALVLSDS